MSSFVVTTLLGRLSSLSGIGALLSGPIAWPLAGLRVLWGVFSQTTAGRLAALVIIGLGVGIMFQNHLVRGERAAWQAEVAKKQQVINGKVAYVEAETAKDQIEAQKTIRANQGVLAVIINELWKRDDKHPVPQETIDLINETRGGSRD